MAALLAWGLSALSASAAEWQIKELEARGKRADRPESAVELQVRASPEAPWGSRKLRINDTLKEGSWVKVPAHVQLLLSSATSVTVRNEYGTPAELELMAGDATRKNFLVRAGAWVFNVLKPLDSVSVSAGRGQLMTRQTVFLVALDPDSGEAKFRVDEGSVAVAHDVAVEVQDRTVAASPVRQLLKAGDKPLLLPGNAAAYLQKFGTLDDAARAFEARWREEQATGTADGQFNALLALGDVLRAAGRGEEALAAYDRALALVPGPRDGYWRAVLQGRRGDALMAQNRFAAATRAYRQSIEEHKAQPVFAGADPVTDQGANLVSASFADGTYRCAQRMTAQLLERLDAAKAISHHPTRIQMMGMQGLYAEMAGQPTQAVQAAEEALARWRRLGAAYAEPLAIALGQSGSALLLAKRPQDALQRYQEALAVSERLFKPPHVLHADARLGIAGVAAARGNAAQALADIDGIVVLLDQAPGDDVVRKGDVRQVRGDLLSSVGRGKEAVVAYEGARTFWLKVWPASDHPRFAQVLPKLSAALRATGTPADETKARELEAALQAGARALAERERECMR